MMKILMTADNIGGVWTFATDLARGMKKHGIEIILAITGKPLSRDQKEKLTGIPWFFEEFRQEWMEDPWYDIEQGGRWLLDIKEETGPELVHLNAYSWGNLDWDIPVLMTLHSCVLTWWDALRNEELPSSWNIYNEMVGSGIRAADLITAPSHAMLNSAEKKYGGFAEKQVVYNGRDPALFRNGKKENIIFSMGRLWDEAKNFRLVLEAASGIRYPVYIAGDNSEWKSSGRIPKNVTLLGHLNQSQVVDWLSRSAIYLLPALYEPFGYTFLEAAFSRCALVGGDIPSLREIWNGSMIYTDCAGPGNLADTVNGLMENEKKRKNSGEMAYRRAIDNYQLDAMVAQYARLYSAMRNFRFIRTEKQEHEH